MAEQEKIETKTRRIATKGKSCTGSIDGIHFTYADGTEDTGIVQTIEVTTTSKRTSYYVVSEDANG